VNRVIAATPARLTTQFGREWFVWLIGILALVALLAWQGLFRYPMPDLSALLSPLSATPSLEGMLLWSVQVPQAVAGLVVGACLGVAGAMMQLMTRNPLVSPDLLGITAGAQLGVILGMVLPSFLGLPLIFVGGVLAASFTFLLAGGTRTTPLRLVLAGMAMAQVFHAMITLLLTMNEQMAMVVSLWDTGSLNQMGWSAMTPAFWLLPPLMLGLLLLRRPLNMSQLGDVQQRSLGLSPRMLKALVILIGTLLTALAIHLAGPLGFIGLVAPNLVRYGFGVRWPSRLLPLAALWGAVLTLTADMLVDGLKVFIELPLGTLSAIIGAIAVILLLRFTHRHTVSGNTGNLMGEGSRLRLPIAPTAVVLFLALAGALWLGVFGAGLDLAALARGEQWAWSLFELRLPRLLVDASGGALFATSGLILQAVTRNPLAGPSVLGVNQWAALAVLAGLIWMPGMDTAWRMVFAWVGAGAALVLIIALNVRHGLEPLRLILTGFALTGLAMGLTSLLIAYHSQNVSLALIWMTGSSYAATWSDLFSLLPWAIPGLVLAGLACRWMNLLVLGDGVASSLGLSTNRIRLLLMVLASLLVAASVAILGPVAFVGLLVPHAVRLLGFYDYRDRLVVTPLLGALLLVLADIAGQRVLAPLDIPLGIMTAAIGAPIFLVLLGRTYFRRGAGQ